MSSSGQASDAPVAAPTPAGTPRVAAAAPAAVAVVSPAPILAGDGSLAAPAPPAASRPAVGAGVPHVSRLGAGDAAAAAAVTAEPVLEMHTHSSRWWDPVPRRGHAKAFHREGFAAQLRTIVTSRLASTFTASTNAKKGDVRVTSEWDVTSVEARLPEPKWNALVAGEAAFPDRSLLPFFTFHGTSSPEVAESILAHGYLMPGQVHPLTGYCNRMRNGAVYGDGVYSSPQFDVAHWYSAIDNGATVHLIINVLVPGTVHAVDPWTDTPPVWLSGSKGYLAHEETVVDASFKGWKAKRRSDGLLITRRTLPTPLHTLRSTDGTIWISGMSSGLVPVGVATIRRKNPFLLYRRIMEEWEACNTHRRPYPQERIRLYHIWGEYYAVGMPDVEETKEETPDARRARRGKPRWINGARPVPQASTAAADDLVTALDTPASASFAGPKPSPAGAVTGGSGSGAGAGAGAGAGSGAPGGGPVVRRAAKNRVHNVFVVPKAAAGDKVSTRALTSLVNGVARLGAQSAVWYGQKPGARRTLPSADSFTAMVGEHRGHKSSGKQRAAAALGSVLEWVTKRDAAEASSSSKREAGDAATDDMVVVYLVIDKPTDTEAEIEKVIAKYQPYVNVRNVVIKLLFLRKDADPALHLRLKGYLQTVTFFESAMQHAKDARLPDLVHNLMGEVDNLPLETATHEVPHPYNVYGEGFVSNLTTVPRWSHTSAGGIAVYKGRRVDVMTVSTPSGYRGHYSTEFVDSKEDTDASIAAVCDAVVPLLAKARNHVLQSRSLAQMYLPRIEALCKAATSRLVAHLKRPDATAVSKSRTCLCQMQALLSEVSTYADVPFAGTWFKRLGRMRFGKRIVKRVEEIKLSDAVAAVGKRLQEPCDALVASRRAGRAVRVHRSGASEADPWLVRISYVSESNMTLREVYLAGEFGKELKDESGEVVTDVVAIQPYPRDVVDRMWAAYSCTRNPYLCLPAQPQALLVDALFRSGCTDVAKWDDAVALTQEVRVSAARNPQLRELLAEMTMTKGADVAPLLTEKSNVTSVCKALAMLAMPGAAPMFGHREGAHSPGGDGHGAGGASGEDSDDIKGAKKPQRRPPRATAYHKLCFAAMAEAVMRACRARLRQSRHSAEFLLQRVLGIDEDADPDAYHFHPHHSAKRTAGLYNRAHELTNCPPSAVVGVLGVLERLHDGEGAAEIAAAIAGHQLSMRQFLRDHLPGQKGYMTQLALYVQGMRYHKSATRQDVSFDDPTAIVAGVRSELLDHVRQRQALLRRAEGGRRAREAARVERAMPYMQYHTMPKLFSEDEVARLNAGRAATDQLERLPTGLLKHHCAYPECPYFLHNFATEVDTRSGSRRGFFRHLQLTNVPLKWYVPGFHLEATTLAQRARAVAHRGGRVMSLAEFYLQIEKRLIGKRQWGEIDHIALRRAVKTVYQQLVVKSEAAGHRTHADASPGAGGAGAGAGAGAGSTS